MDGRKASLTGSLQFRLSAALSALIAAFAVGAATFSYLTAFGEAIEWQDANLRQMSAMTDGRNVQADQPTTIIDTVPDPDLQVIVEIVGPNDASPPGSPFKIVPPLRDGLQTLHAGADAWRLYARPLQDGSRLVVAQRSAERDEIARDSALRAILPLAALVPLLIVLIGVVVRGALRSVTAMSHDLDARSEHDLRPLQDAPIPNELLPFVGSINALLAKLRTALAAQNRFVAVAAHELRSPLAALTLQTEQLAERISTAEEKEFMSRVQSGMARMRGLLDQLLTLARAEASIADSATPHSLAAILRGVLEEVLPLAEARQVDLGVVGDLPDATIVGRAGDIHAMLRNLVDNAVRYTPAGGRVDVQLRRDDRLAVIEISDDGPGISDDEIQRVFDPFYRVLGNGAVGSGLGLAIVRAVATRLGGSVSLASGIGHGLRVQVELPSASGAAA